MLIVHYYVTNKGNLKSKNQPYGARNFLSTVCLYTAILCSINVNFLKPLLLCNFLDTKLHHHSEKDGCIGIRLKCRPSIKKLPVP